jgi:hypothetical protein
LSWNFTQSGGSGFKILFPEAGGRLPCFTRKFPSPFASGACILIRNLSDEILKRVYIELTNAGEDKLVQEKNSFRGSGNKRSEQGETGTADTDHPGSIERKAECLEGTGGRE